MNPTKWFFVAIVLGFDFITFIAIAQNPQKNSDENTYNSEPNEDHFSQLINGHEVQQVVSRPKRIPEPFGGFPKILNPFGWKNSHSRRKHHLHHRHDAFLLQCPQPPQENFNQVLTKTQIGVEFLHNDVPLIKISSDGRRFESEEISAVEEWKTVHNRLNVVAHGPRGESRYRFEFNETKGWYAIRIVYLKPIDVGIWQCKAKLRYKNGIIQQFDSRKIIRMSDVPMNQMLVSMTTTPIKLAPSISKTKLIETTTKNSVLIETTTVDAAVEIEFGEINNKKYSHNEKSQMINYSDPPLFSFAKPIGDPMFSRVDRRRDVFIAYVRSDVDNEKDNTEPESRPKKPVRKHKHKVSSQATTIKSLFALILIIL